MEFKILINTSNNTHSPGERADIIRHLASSLLASEGEIMEANDRDLRAAKARGVTGPLFDR